MDIRFRFIDQEDKDHVNRFVKEEHDALEHQKFSDVYSVLFPDTEFTPSMKSFLKELNTFKFKATIDIEKVQKAEQVADEICSHIARQLPLNQDFIAFLIWVYPEVIRSYGTIRALSKRSFDNIFGFMNGFEIQDTKVVIIGQDPSPDFESSGYAYHGSVCSSTKNIFDFLNIEFYLADVNNNCQFTLKPSETKSLKEHCQMDGWIKQGVLMFNTYLTLDFPDTIDEKVKFEPRWEIVTRFLVKKLCKLETNLVFILTGSEAERQVSNLIQDANLKEEKKHAIFIVLHPIQNNANWDRKRALNLDKWGTKHWNVDLPFLNTNFYLYQLHQDKDKLMDWHDISESNLENQVDHQRRRATWVELYDKLLALTNQVQDDTRVYTDNESFPISGVPKVLELKRNSIIDFYEMRFIDAVKATTGQLSRQT